MTTSGTTSFDLDLNALVEEAFERCGAELRTGYDLRTARRSLNMLTIEWANRGINLWTIEQGTQALTAGDGSYNLPADTIDLIEHVIRTGSGANQSDVSIARISASNYATISAKNSEGRPSQIWIDRRVAQPVANLWPVPDTDDYTLVYWRLRRMEDAGTAGTTTQDIPFRLLPALVAGLAYYLSFKLPDAMDRMPVLQAEYERQWQMAQDEDREKATLRLVPGRR